MINMSDQTANGISSKLNLNIDINKKDKMILKELALELKEIASQPCQTKKADLWLAHNDLQPVRPMVFCDPENGWSEIITQDMILCETELGKEWEMVLRKEICWGKNMKDDKVIEAVFDVPYVTEESDWGMHEERIGGGDGGSYVWDAPLKSLDDIDKLHFPQITVDFECTKKLLETAKDIFDGILKVRLKNMWWWTLGMTMTLVNLRGLETIMFDMYDHPDELHKLMELLRDGHLYKLKFLEENGLLPDNTGNTYVGSGGFGFTKELPKPGFDPEHVRLMDMWGFAESQETTGISVQMFAEFIFPYQLPILEKFGLNCYGCCEPLEKRWEYVQKIPNLRRVSVSPWANAPEMADLLQNRYIYSHKPNPAYLAVPHMDEELIRKSIRNIINVAKDCVLEFIMKDNNTLGGNPNNAYRWVEIAFEEINNA